jgi:hypothetical protein
MRQSIIIILGAILLWSCADKSSKINEDRSVQQSINDTTSVFAWTTELCENKGTYYPRKYSAEQLQNTYDLWFRFSGIALETDGTANKPEDISTLDTNKLANEYKKQKKYLEQIVIVNLTYWQKLKQLKIQELEDEFELKKITIQSYSNTSVLQSNRFSKYCPDFVRVLTSNDTSELMTFWKGFADKQSLKNGSPEKYMEKFYEKFNSKNRLNYARVDLITYGWWNCANHTLTHIHRDGQMEEEFNKLFLDIKSECEEP